MHNFKLCHKWSLCAWYVLRVFFTLQFSIGLQILVATFQILWEKKFSFDGLCRRNLLGKRVTQAFCKSYRCFLSGSWQPSLTYEKVLFVWLIFEKLWWKRGRDFICDAHVEVFYKFSSCFLYDFYINLENSSLTFSTMLWFSYFIHCTESLIYSSFLTTCVISAQNLLLSSTDDNAVLKIADFGFARYILTLNLF